MQNNPLQLAAHTSVAILPATLASNLDPVSLLHVLGDACAEHAHLTCRRSCRLVMYCRGSSYCAIMRLLMMRDSLLIIMSASTCTKAQHASARHCCILQVPYMHACMHAWHLRDTGILHAVGTECKALLPDMGFHSAASLIASSSRANTCCTR